MARPEVIADMSATIVDLLTPALQPLPCEVRLSDTDEYRTFAPVSPTVTVFLYHVAVNGELRNNERQRLSDGSIAAPFLPIELRYLITPWASQPGTNHLILGHVMRVLARYQAMDRKQLSGTSWDVDDSVQLLPERLPVDEYHDIWEPAEIPYKLSLSYLARVFGLSPATSEELPVVTSASFIGPP